MKALADCRILLVDDTKANIDILVAGLRTEYKLSVALSGQTALQLAARVSPDLILLDVLMPDLDGYEVCRRLRARPETAEVPIVFISALDEVGNKALGFEVGANDYITKPFDLTEVKARVRSLLKAKAYNEAVKEQIAGELRVARDIQMGMLPRDFSNLERDYGVSVAARLLPAGEVGGDLFAAFAPDPDRLVLVMGDVSGKGIPAALFMVRTLSMVRLLARDIRAPEQILARLNDELAADNPSSMFVTLCCAVFEPRSCRLTLASGGQTRPVLLRDGEAPQFVSDHLGTALGLEPGLTFTSTELSLAPSDTLLFYTDGVTEAFNSQGECYTTSRLLDGLYPLSRKSPEALATALLAQVETFAGVARQSDDIAILVFRVESAAPKATRCSFEFAATAQEVMHAVEELRSFGTAHGLSASDIFALSLALEECGSNIVQHALGNDPGQRFQVAFEHRTTSLCVRLCDTGLPLNPSVLEGMPVKDPDDSGGWGLHLARSFLDDINYAREGDKNLWCLTKHLRESSLPEPFALCPDFT
jgi:sigma-B regulation protein RsbU (phosphoserine phosphatase)